MGQGTDRVAHVVDGVEEADQVVAARVRRRVADVEVDAADTPAASAAAVARWIDSSW